MAASDAGSVATSVGGFGSQIGYSATSPIAGGSTGAAAGSDGADCTEGHFKCACCELDKPNSMMKMRGESGDMRH